MYFVYVNTYVCTQIHLVTMSFIFAILVPIQSQNCKTFYINIPLTVIISFIHTRKKNYIQIQNRTWEPDVRQMCLHFEWIYNNEFLAVTVVLTCTRRWMDRYHHPSFIFQEKLNINHISSFLFQSPWVWCHILSRKSAIVLPGKWTSGGQSVLPSEVSRCSLTRMLLFNRKRIY